MQTATNNVGTMDDQEIGRERVYRNARTRGGRIAGALMQRARDRAKRVYEQANVNETVCEMEVHAAAWDISEVCYQTDKATVDEILARRNNPSDDYKSAVSGFLSQADQCGAVVLTGRKIFVADYDLLIAVLGPCLERLS
jgi:hypothetical protein